MSSQRAHLQRGRVKMKQTFSKSTPMLRNREWSRIRIRVAARLGVPSSATLFALSGEAAAAVAIVL